MNWKCVHACFIRKAGTNEHSFWWAATAKANALQIYHNTAHRSIYFKLKECCVWPLSDATHYMRAFDCGDIVACRNNRLQSQHCELPRTISFHSVSSGTDVFKLLTFTFTLAIQIGSAPVLVMSPNVINSEAGEKYPITIWTTQTGNLNN